MSNTLDETLDKFLREKTHLGYEPDVKEAREYLKSLILSEAHKAAIEELGKIHDNAHGMIDASDLRDNIMVRIKELDEQRLRLSKITGVKE